MRSKATLALLALLAALGAPGAAPAIVSLGESDAGAGDAPGSCASARPIPLGPRPGELDHYQFGGTMRDADFADFYAVDAVAGRTLTIGLLSDRRLDGANLDLFLYGPTTPNGSTDCDVVIQASTFGVNPGARSLPEVVALSPVPITGTYTFEVRRIVGESSYEVDLAVVNTLPTMPGNDALTSADASDTCAAPTPLSIGVYQGTLIDVPHDDRNDWYAIEVGANEDLSAVLKPADLANLDLELYAPDCSEVPSDRLTLNRLPFSSPETAHMTTPPPGLYRLRVTREATGDPANYVLTVTLTPPLS